MFKEGRASTGRARPLQNHCWSWPHQVPGSPHTPAALRVPGSSREGRGVLAILGTENSHSRSLLPEMQQQQLLGRLPAPAQSSRHMPLPATIHAAGRGRVPDHGHAGKCMQLFLDGKGGPGDRCAGRVHRHGGWAWPWECVMRVGLGIWAAERSLRGRGVRDDSELEVGGLICGGGTCSPEVPYAWKYFPVQQSRMTACGARSCRHWVSGTGDS